MCRRVSAEEKGCPGRRRTATCSAPDSCETARAGAWRVRSRRCSGKGSGLLLELVGKLGTGGSRDSMSCRCCFELLLVFTQESKRIRDNFSTHTLAYGPSWLSEDFRRSMQTLLGSTGQKLGSSSCNLQRQASEPVAATCGPKSEERRSLSLVAAPGALVFRIQGSSFLYIPLQLAFLTHFPGQ